MLYLTGFQNWDKQFGGLISIANSEPPGFKGHIRRLPFLVPDWTTVNLWRQSPKTEQDWQAFVATYRVLCKERWDAIARWLETLDPRVDNTLLCWEPRSSRCHRSLVAKIIENYRPDCYGGLDVVNAHRKRCLYNEVVYDIEVTQAPWCEGFCFYLSVGKGYCCFNENPEHPYLKGPYALPEYAIAAAVAFIKGGTAEFK